MTSDELEVRLITTKKVSLCDSKNVATWLKEDHLNLEKRLKLMIRTSRRYDSWCDLVMLLSWLLLDLWVTLSKTSLDTIRLCTSTLCHTNFSETACLVSPSSVGKFLIHVRCVKDAVTTLMGQLHGRTDSAVLTLCREGLPPSQERDVVLFDFDHDFHQKNGFWDVYITG